MKVRIKLVVNAIRRFFTGFNFSITLKTPFIDISLAPSNYSASLCGGAVFCDGCDDGDDDFMSIATLFFIVTTVTIVTWPVQSASK